MIATENIYQSILHRLSEIPSDYLPQIDSYLKELTMMDKRNNQVEIMKLAGSWSNMSEKDFQEYLVEAKKTEIFSRKITL
jgi:hypothetical protein